MRYDLSDHIMIDRPLLQVWPCVTDLVPVVLPLPPGIPEPHEAGIAAADVGCGRCHALNAARATTFSRERSEHA